MILGLETTLDLMTKDESIDAFLREMSKNISTPLFIDKKLGELTQTPQVTTYSHAPFCVRRGTEKWVTYFSYIFFGNGFFFCRAKGISVDSKVVEKNRLGCDKNSALRRALIFCSTHDEQTRIKYVLNLEKVGFKVHCNELTSLDSTLSKSRFLHEINLQLMVQMHINFSVSLRHGR